MKIYERIIELMDLQVSLAQKGLDPLYRIKNDVHASPIGSYYSNFLVDNKSKKSFCIPEYFESLEEKDLDQFFSKAIDDSVDLVLEQEELERIQNLRASALKKLTKEEKEALDL